jgi:hypothetical protein
MSQEVIEVIERVVEVVEVVKGGPQGPQGLIGPAGTTSWDGITNKPSEFPPEAHTHELSEITDANLLALLVGDDDIEITDPAKGLIIRNTNGHRYRLTIDNNGILTSTKL